MIRLRELIDQPVVLFVEAIGASAMDRPGQGVVFGRTALPTRVGLVWVREVRGRRKTRLVGNIRV